MTESAPFYLSVVIPAYNEEKRISKILDSISQYQQKHTSEMEVIVVIDASSDGTEEITRSYSGRIKNLKVIVGVKNIGKGGAIAGGVKEARGQYILFADADNSTPFEQVDNLLKYANDFGVVIASRYCKGGKLLIPQPFSRRIGGRALNLLVQSILLPGLKDTQCGFKLFKAELAKVIFAKMTINRWSFDLEILAIARYLGAKIKEVGVIWLDNPHSRVNPIRDGVQMIKDAWTIKRNIRQDLYK